MKRYRLAAIRGACVLIGVFVLLILFIACAFSVKGHYIEILFIPQQGFGFGASSQKADAVFGAPTKTEKNVCDTGQTMRVYESFILDKNAVITCYFTPGNKLIEMDIRWETDSIEDAHGLMDGITHIITDTSRDFEGFYKSETKSDSSGVASISLGVNSGATGLIYSVDRTDVAVNLQYVLIN